jgi:hypothetical protein
MKKIKHRVIQITDHVPATRTGSCQPREGIKRCSRNAKRLAGKMSDLTFKRAMATIR